MPLVADGIIVSARTFAAGGDALVDGGRKKKWLEGQNVLWRFDGAFPGGDLEFPGK